MIAFDIECSNGHIFEGWFKSIESFEDQNAKKMVSCPYCNDTKTKKVLSPVVMKTSTPSRPEGDGKQIDYQRLAHEMVNYINKNFKDVGHDFRNEALKMHYGVTEKRNIKGSATYEDEKVLEKEGVEFFKIPILKIDEDKKN